MGQTRTKGKRAPVNKVTAGFRVSDKLWAVLEPLLPVRQNTHRFGGGKPRTPDRQCADAIFYVFRTGCQWGALDATGLCPHSTAHDRFQEWVAAGVFRRLGRAGIERFDELQGVDWDWVSMDGAMTKAPLGGEKNRPQSDRPRQSRRQAQCGDRGQRGARRADGRRGKSQ
jgi:putative transposase